MKNFYIVTNSSKEKGTETAERIKVYLESKGADVISKEGYCEYDDFPKEIECIIVLGGDGTMINVATETAGLNIPIIGINIGHLGYLTTINEEEDIYPTLDKLLNDEYKIESRSLLCGEWDDEDGHHKAYALNEIVIGRKMMLHAVTLKISVNGEFLNEYSADGIIVATPTGSTAYNLSAGGPIVEADSDMMVVTAICPHAFIPTSIVLTGKNRLEIKVMRGDINGQIAVFDGTVKGELSIGSRVFVRKAGSEVRMIRIGNETFISNLQRKLGELQG